MYDHVAEGAELGEAPSGKSFFLVNQHKTKGHCPRALPFGIKGWWVFLSVSRPLCGRSVNRRKAFRCWGNGALKSS